MRLTFLSAAVALVSLAPAAHASGPATEHPAVLIHAEFLAKAPPPPRPVAVCVLDSGITPNAELPASTVIESSALDGGSGDDVGNPGAPYPASLFPHGTHVAQVIAGRTTGVWPWARIINVRVFDRGDGGGYRQYADGLDRCIVSSTSRSARSVVANLSIVSSVGSEADRRFLELQVSYARFNGLSVIASTGNAGVIEFPADQPGVIPVGASDTGATNCSFSAVGSFVLAALGCNVRSADAHGAPEALVGTSFAAPAITAVLAAVRAYRPDLTLEQAEEALYRASAPRVSGGPRILDAEALFASLGLASMLKSPRNERPPQIGGTPGAPAGTLTCYPGRWWAARGASVSWLLDGRRVAEGPTLAWVPSRVGVLSCRERAWNLSGLSDAVSSALLLTSTTRSQSVESTRPRPVPRPRTVRHLAVRGRYLVVSARAGAGLILELRLANRRVRGRGPTLRIRRTHGVKTATLRAYDPSRRRYSAPIVLRLPPLRR